MATTTYCLPSTAYVIGAPVVPAGSSVSQTTAPVVLSKALNIRPPPPGGVARLTGSPSPTNSSVFVSSGAARPGWPSGGRCSGASDGWVRGPSPFGTVHLISPRFRSIAVTRPYGGFVNGSPRGPATYWCVPYTYRRLPCSGARFTSPTAYGAVMDGTYSMP